MSTNNNPTMVRGRKVKYVRHYIINTLVGSNADNGLNTEPLNLNVNNATSISNTNVGSRESLTVQPIVVPLLNSRDKQNNKTTLLAGSNVERQVVTTL